MWLNKIPIYLVLGVCLITAVALFHIKDNVMMLRTELKEVKKQVQNEEDTIHILKAELAYLASPERLQHLVTEYLDLKSIKVAQMIKDPIIQDEEVITREIVSAKLNNNIKWRYKKGPAKYVTTVSEKR